MSGAYASALSVRLRPSRQLALAVGIIDLGAIVSLWMLSWPWWLSLILTAALLAHGAFSVSCALLKSPHAITMLRIDDRLAWRHADAGDWQIVRVKSLFVHPLAVVLLAKPPAVRARSVVILPDSLDAETLNRLRARLNQLRLKPKSDTVPN